MPESMVAPEAAGTSLRLEQRAKLSSYLGLSLKNGFLNLLTLTLYRFWGKTEVRRRIWSSTYLNDEAFEYTGRGMELFIGFLIATGLTLVFLLFVFGIQFLGPFAVLLILPLYVGLIGLIGFAIYAAFRYLASRTAWRGVRFHLAGSAASYGLKYFGLMILTGVTLGWAWPFVERKLAEPLWANLRFGDRPFRFSLVAARKENVYGAFTLMWLGGIVGYAVLASLFMGVAMQPDFDPEGDPAAFFAIYAVALLFGLLFLLISLPYRAAMMRSVARGIQFEGVKVRLKIGALAVGWLYLGNFLLVMISLGFLMPLVQARSARFILNRLVLEGEVDFDAIHQSAESGPRQGEGLADAFGLSII
ncbi:MAG: YjgN family protein [Phenylobacterium sp.]|nr:YjgN family protein [Phenylobacterium sp.]